MFRETITPHHRCLYYVICMYKQDISKHAKMSGPYLQNRPSNTWPTWPRFFSFFSSKPGQHHGLLARSQHPNGHNPLPATMAFALSRGKSRQRNDPTTQRMNRGRKRQRNDGMRLRPNLFWASWLWSIGFQAKIRGGVTCMTVHHPQGSLEVWACRREKKSLLSRSPRY